MHLSCRYFSLNFGKASQIANQVRYVALMLYKLQLNQSQIFGPSYFDSALGNIQYTVSYIWSENELTWARLDWFYMAAWIKVIKSIWCHYDIIYSIWHILTTVYCKIATTALTALALPSLPDAPAASLVYRPYTNEKSPIFFSSFDFWITNSGTLEKDNPTSP